MPRIKKPETRSGRLRIGDDLYAVGLIWRLAGDEEDLSLQARRVARKEGFDYIAPLKSDAGRFYAQFGLGRRADGHQWRMRSAAAALVRRGGSFAGAFRAGGHRATFWLVVIREGLVMQDMLCDEDVARDRLLEAAALSQNLRLFAPAGWALPGAVEIDLPLMLDEADGQGASRLGFAERRHKALRIVAIAASLATAVLILPVISRLMLPPPSAPPILLPPVIRLWESAPRPAEWAAACRAGLSLLPAAIQGWKFVGAVCEDGQAIVEWERKAGSPAFIPQDLVIDASAQRARMGRRLSVPAQRGKQDLWDRNKVTAFLLGNAADSTWTVKSPAPIGSSAAGQAAPPTAPTPWKLRDVSFVAPKDWLGPVRLFDAVPGAVLTRMTLTDAGWKIEGVIYELG